MSSTPIVAAAPKKVAKVRSPSGVMKAEATPVGSGDEARLRCAPAAAKLSAKKAPSASGPTLPATAVGTPR